MKIFFTFFLFSVPVIPKYLLHISHSNISDIFLSEKLSLYSEMKEKHSLDDSVEILLNNSNEGDKSTNNPEIKNGIRISTNNFHSFQFNS